MREKIQTEYKSRIILNSNILQSLKQQSIRVAWARGIVFLLGAIISIYLLYQFWQMAVVFAFLSIIPFIYLLLKSIKLKNKIYYYSQLVEINKLEYDSLDWKYGKFRNGKHYIENDKSFLFDLDIFGEGSIFQYLNRSATSSGEKLLASWFLNSEKNKEEIEARQLAVVELTPLVDWRQDFLASGKLLDESISEKREISGWLHKEMFFSKIKFLSVMLKIIPLLSIALLVLTILGIVPFGIFILYLLLPLSIIGRYLKKINDEQRIVNYNYELLKKYARLLVKIEKGDFKSLRLGGFQYVLTKEKFSASEKVKELSKIISGLENRNNMLVGFLLDALLMWDLQYMIKLEKWRNENKNYFTEWVKIISEFDALSSLANYAYNNPAYVFPDVNTNKFQLQLVECGHPLIHEDQRVNNSFEYSDSTSFFIVTGANMAGKSTFLRTLGVNLILAMTGAPICAHRFSFSPIDIFTSMRTRDSLQKNESYFFAELSRLKELIDKLKAGKKLFIILDEVLKGTNSEDKRHGSVALLKQLVGIKTTGVIATHDVSLGQLEKDFPGIIVNKRFEVEIENNELVFDYKIKDGISQNLNATFLMKKMGITI